MKRILILLLVITQVKTEVPRVKTRDWGERGQAIEKIYAQASNDRNNLKNLRNEQIALFEAEAAKPNPNYLSLTPGITSGMIDYINTIIDETAKKMGPAPTRFEIFTMGSMARDESGFFTDLEIGILVAEKTPEVKRYFEKFAQLLSDRFYLLGEHPDVGGKGLRIDEADNAPLHLKWFARYASNKQVDDLLDEALRKRKFEKIPFEGSRIFIATPKEFAEYSNPKILDEKTLKDAKDQYRARIEALVETAWQDKVKELDLNNMTDAERAAARAEVRKEVKEEFDGVLKPLSRKEYNTAKSLQTLVRNIRHLYGDKQLLDEYLKDREVYLQGPPKKKNPFYPVNRRQELAYNKDIEELSKPISDFSSPIRGKIGESVDLKRQLYRFIEQVLTDQGFWHNLPVQNTEQILQELVKRGEFNKDFADQVRDAMNFITGLRLKEQAILRKQGFAIPASVEEWESTQEDIEDTIKNLQNLKDHLIDFKAPQEDIEKVSDKITKADSELRNLQKMKPLNIGSILTLPEIDELNTKYLPILHALYEANIEFLKGNQQAFTRGPVEFETPSTGQAPEEKKKEYVMPRVRIREWGPKFESVVKLYGQAVADRSNLATLREKEIEKFWEEAEKPNPDYLSLTPGITEATITYINNMVAEIIAKLGPPPTEFSLFTMGSMARDESGFYTDLEVGILVDKKDQQVKKYFDKFAQLLADRLYLLGEHPTVGGKGLRIDEADNAPLHMKWFARYATPARAQELLELANKVRKKELKPEEGSRIFLATPEEFASYLDPKILDKIEIQKEHYKDLIQEYINDAWELEQQKPENLQRTKQEVKDEVHQTYDALIKPLFGREKAVLASLLSLTRNLRHLYGNKSIFDRYINESNQYLAGPPSVANPNYETRRQEIVTDVFLGNIVNDIADPSALVHGKLEDEIDLKRKLYRWPEQTLTNLSYWYKLKTQNGKDIIDTLENNGLMDPLFAKKLRDLLNFATGLRLKEQAVLRKQGKFLPLTQEEWAKNKADLKEQLEFQKKLEDFAITANRPAPEIEAAHDKVREISDALHGIDKLKPFEPGSILQVSDVNQLKTKYLPILIELFERVQAFVSGDHNAFIESGNEFIKKHPVEPVNKPTYEEPVKQPQPAEVPKPAEPTAPAQIALPSSIPELQALAKKMLSPNPADVKMAIAARKKLIELQGKIF